MKIRIIGLAVGVSTLALWGTACEQPGIDCRALHAGPYAAKYTLVSGDAACSTLKGETIGLQSFYEARDDRKNVNLERSFLSIRTATQGDLEAAAIENGEPEGGSISKVELNATGNFKSPEPDASDVCFVPTLTPSEIDVKAIPATMDFDGSPATNVKYEWRNIRLLVSPANPGNLLKADLTYSADGCSATYSVVALWPTIGCEELILETDEDGEPVVSGTGKPNDALCDDKADPQAPYNIPFGSGISQDVVPKCDPELLFCVATKEGLIP